jgi:hypothetical protein
MESSHFPGPIWFTIGTRNHLCLLLLSNFISITSNSSIFDNIKPHWHWMWNDRDVHQAMTVYSSLPLISLTTSTHWHCIRKTTGMNQQCFWFISITDFDHGCTRMISICSNSRCTPVCCISKTKYHAVPSTIPNPAPTSTCDIVWYNKYIRE